MSLTTGRGPLSPRRAGHFSPPIPDDVVYVEPFSRRVRGFVGDRCVVDSEEVRLVHRAGRPPTYVFPVGDVLAGHGVTAAPEPLVPGWVAVDWSSVETWYEEDEQVFGHPRNPYHRVDCIRTARPLRVEVAVEVAGVEAGGLEVGGVELAATGGAMGVYETALVPKFYVDRSSVRMELLRPSATTTYCPYKGTASYWSAVVDGFTFADVAWSYDDPLPECLRIAGMLCFDEGPARVIHDPAPGR